MRKISELAAQAFLHGQKFNRDNTSVRVESDGAVEMYLHGHLIARRVPKLHGCTMVSVSLAGWPTPTTRERLNGLLNALGAPVMFYQSKHNQWLGAEQIDSDSWNTIGTRC